MIDLNVNSILEKQVILNNLCCDIYYTNIHEKDALSINAFQMIKQYYGRTLNEQATNIIDRSLDISECLSDIHKKYVLGQCSLATLLNSSLEDYEFILDEYIKELEISFNFLKDNNYI